MIPRPYFDKPQAKKPRRMMLTNQTRITDLTVEELQNLIRRALREELRQQPVAAPRHQAALGTRTATGGWLVRRAEAPQP
jgi:hypothetical protein